MSSPVRTGKLEHNSMTVCQMNRGLRFDPKMISLVYIHGMLLFTFTQELGEKVREDYLS